MPSQIKLKEYDSEPVTFCSRCYSLKIIYEDAIGADCCGECGCSDVQTASIEEWESLFKKRYGHSYVNSVKDIRKSPIFLMSIDKLKTLVYNHPEWKFICKTLYPSFPDGLSKSDSVILLFAKLCNDNKLDTLRFELINRNKK